MKENSKKFMNISIWVTTILLMIRCLISLPDIQIMLKSGQLISLCYSVFGFVGETIGMAAIIMAVFNKWGWKWKLFRWLHNVPILASKYTGTFISDYDGKERSGNIIIHQTFLTVTVQLKTCESFSRSIIASFCEVQNVSYLVYTYQNDPRAEIQDQSPIHYGTAMLDVTEPMTLEGNFYTGRKSRGSMKFSVEK
ncbi:MAG: hypothetical protein PHV32_15770 [Eubacteriales bacterium]|nr:hypothetical protein [Eubacteriales bacterium]